jgi:serine protease Do
MDEFKNLNDENKNVDNVDTPPTPPTQSWQPYDPNNSWNFNSYDEPVPPTPKPPKKRFNTGKVVAICLCAALIITTFGFAGYGVYRAFSDITVKVPSGVQDTSSFLNTSSVPSIVLNNKPTTETVVADGEKLSGEMVYTKLSPSIVGILSYSTGTSSRLGSGSGVIISSDGYIVTNHHVIENGQLIEVVLNNNERYRAKVIGGDARSDLAVIKIEATNLVAVSFGNSDELKSGEKVYAMGNPGGLDLATSISDGIISGTNRLMTSETGYTMNFIQTTAAINPGNSGGALINEYGHVIGICSAKIVDLDYEGIGFAIPVTSAKKVIEDLMKYGYVTGRPNLGISYSYISSTYAMYYSLPTGILVSEIDQNACAYKAGVRVNDIIAKVDNVKIDSNSHFLDIMGNYKPGDTVTLTVFRRVRNTADQTFEVKVVLDEDTGKTTSLEQSQVSGTPATPSYPSDDIYEFFKQWGLAW